MTTIKTRDLSGIALDWALAKARQYPDVKVFMPHRPTDRGWIEVRFNREPKAACARYDPSRNWEQAGPLMEEYELDVHQVQRDIPLWQAEAQTGPRARVSCMGPTPLIAICRCVVKLHLGDEVTMHPVFDGWAGSSEPSVVAKPMPYAPPAQKFPHTVMTRGEDLKVGQTINYWINEGRGVEIYGFSAYTGTLLSPARTALVRYVKNGDNRATEIVAQDESYYEVMS